MLVVLLPLLGLLVMTASGHRGGRHGDSSEEEEGGEGRGICLNGMEIAALCVQNTTFGEKIAAAMAACMAPPPAAGRHSPPSGGKTRAVVKFRKKTVSDFFLSHFTFRLIPNVCVVYMAKLHFTKCCENGHSLISWYESSAI
jgi:hypothetical protein